MRLSVDHGWLSIPPLAALTLLAACVSGGEGRAPIAAAPATGPAADYPMVLGAPFTIDTVTYTPEDKLNYDAVGLAVPTDGAGAGISGAHKTLPLPSYVEVTALDSGRTILVRLTERGPMRGDALIGLSPAAAGQLGIAATPLAPIRVRRVNPGEQERALLRKGAEAPARMDTPQPLLKVLKRKLAEQDGSGRPVTMPAPVSAVSPTAAASMTALPATNTPNKPTPSRASDSFAASFPVEETPAPAKPVAAPTPVKPAAIPKPVAAPKPAAPKAPAPAAPAAKPPAAPSAATPSANASGRFVVQAATFSTETRANAAAKAVGGFVTRAGKYWYLRLGPYSSTAEARAGLEKARRAGYTDARVSPKG